MSLHLGDQHFQGTEGWLANSRGEVFLWMLSQTDISRCLSYTVVLEFSLCEKEWGLRLSIPQQWWLCLAQASLLFPWACIPRGSPAASMTEAQAGSKERISTSSLLQGDGMCMYKKSCFRTPKSFRLEKIFKIIESKHALEMEIKCCKL